MENDLLRELLSTIPEPDRETALAAAAAAIARIHTQHGVEPPAWLVAASGQPPEQAVDEYEHFFLAVLAAESVRVVCRREVRQHPKGITGVAREAGVRLAAFRGFLSGSLLNPETWGKLTEWARAHDVAAAPMPLVGLAMISHAFPARMRAKVRTAIGMQLAAYLGAKGIPEPAWLTDETEWP